MPVDDQLGPLAGKSAFEVEPSDVQTSQRAHYEHWVTKELGHLFLFDYSNSLPDLAERHFHRLSELKGIEPHRLTGHIRTLYHRAINRRHAEFRWKQESDLTEAFMARQADCYGSVAKIVSTLDGHLGLAPESVEWRHVVGLGYAKQSLEHSAKLLRTPVAYR
jgi:hypothetical protein